QSFLMGQIVQDFFFKILKGLLTEIGMEGGLEFKVQIRIQTFQGGDHLGIGTVRIGQGPLEFVEEGCHGLLGRHSFFHKCRVPSANQIYPARFFKSVKISVSSLSSNSVISPTRITLSKSWISSLKWFNAFSRTMRFCSTAQSSASAMAKSS